MDSSSSFSSSLYPSFSVLNANIGSMYLWSIKKRLPSFLREFYGSLFGHGRTPSSGLETVAKLIQHYQPTLVCLQEVYGTENQKPAQFNEIEKFLGPGYRWFVQGKGLENRAVVVQTKAVNGGKAEVLATSESAPFGIAYKLDKPTAWIASVHLRYSNLAERTQQLEELLRWADSKKEPVLLAGDFNTHIHFASREKKQAAYHTFHSLQKYGFDDLSASVNCTWRWGKYLPTARNIKLDHFFGRGVHAVGKPFTIRAHLRGWMDHLALFGPEFKVE